MISNLPTFILVQAFAQLLASGQKMTTPEDLEFYANHKAAIEVELQKLKDIYSKNKNNSNAR
jgi:hypothetical protein